MIARELNTGASAAQRERKVGGTSLAAIGADLESTSEASLFTQCFE